ncbi:unnamed protein product [Bursaphelenchus xylophilus]|nr:unnamed protein product [Bursaphelenchus xylophilus]CAG9130817.1 unnamed protein product [Bursaphelenchus xylophilus]
MDSLTASGRSSQNPSRSSSPHRLIDPSQHLHLPFIPSRKSSDSSGKYTPTFSFGRRNQNSMGTCSERDGIFRADRPRLPVRMMRRVKVAALPGTSNSDENSRATTPNLEFLNENYTKNEIEDYRQLFCMFDTDGSGAIGNEELKEAIISIGLQADDQEIDALIREVDEDGNGEIDFAEFCHCMKKSQSLVKSTNEELIKQCFNVFDQDGNGVITANEFMYIAKEIGGFSDELAEYVFHELDVSANGHLSTDQFAAIVEDYLLTDQRKIFDEDK